MLNPILDWFLLQKARIIVSVLILIAYIIIQRYVFPRIEYLLERDDFNNEVLQRTIFILNMFVRITTFVILLIIWGIDIDNLVAVSTGLIALLGAALFASWSILSNVTAFFILLSHQSYKKGTFIRIFEADNYIEGYINDINLLHTRLLSENNEVIVYPNNQLIAKPVIVNPADRHNVVGKTQDMKLARELAPNNRHIEK